MNDRTPLTPRAADRMPLRPTKHPLPPAGFGPEGSYDIDRYIRDSTHQIWDEKFIGKI